jgi:hypothetical protein
MGKQVPQTDQKIIYATDTHNTEGEKSRRWLQQNVQFYFTVGGVLVTLLNLYLVSQLAPIVQDLGLLGQRVEAIEEEHGIYQSDHERVVILEQVIIPIREDITEIKQDIKDIKSLLNNL